MFYRAVLGLFLGWMLMPQTSLAVSQSFTVTARVPLSLTQQFLIAKNSTVSLHRPFGSADLLLKVSLAGLGGAPQAEHLLRYTILDSERQLLTDQQFVVDRAGVGEQQVVLTALVRPRYLQVWDTAFKQTFLVREIPLICPQYTCYDPLPTDILITGRIPRSYFGYEGQNTTLGATIASNRPSRLLASSAR